MSSEKKALTWEGLGISPAVAEGAANARAAGFAMVAPPAHVVQPADLPRYGPFRPIITGYEHILVGYGLLSDEQVRERGGCHLPGCECPVALEQKQARYDALFNEGPE